MEVEKVKEKGKQAQKGVSPSSREGLEAETATVCEDQCASAE